MRIEINDLCYYLLAGYKQNPYSAQQKAVMDLNRVIEVENDVGERVPMYPAKILLSHVTLRGAQAGSVFGLLFVTPALGIFQRLTVSSAWIKGVKSSTMIGGLAVAAYTLGKHWDDTDGVDDRAYRIAFNKSQTKVDEYAMGGALFGLGGGLILSASLGRSAILAGTYSGLSVGLAAYMAQKEFNEMFNKPPQL